MSRSFYNRGTRSLRHPERGMVLIITLLALVAMLLVSTALLRSTGTSVQVVNNLSFRQAAEAPANMAVELAAQAISDAGGGGTLPTGCPGFYSFRQNESAEGIPTLLLSQPAGPNTCSISVSGMLVTYIVEQMCAAPGGVVNSANCLLSRTGGGGGGAPGADGEVYADGGRRLGAVAGGGAGAGGGGAPATGTPVYRVSMRVDGVKNTTVFAQAFID
ncbi:MAG: hypothetical protein FWC42_04585 [Proteobacteria bacterium]|nr:hypothetical protein [Pseudomonadota bacterium]